jgi:hypothetical protein
LDVEEHDQALWVLSDASAPEELTFAGVAHPSLRHVAIINQYPPQDEPLPSDCGARLRQRYFPRLRRLTVYDEEYPVWLPRQTGRRRNAT